MKVVAFRIIAGVIALGLLASCGGGRDDAPKRDVKAASSGKGFTVLSSKKSFEADPSLAETQVEWIDPKSNLFWSQRGGNAGNAFGTVAANGFKPKDKTSIGEGYGWDTVLVPSPVVAEGVVYAMDARGYVSAHDTADIDKTFWVSNAAKSADEEGMLGGGLAVAGNQLFVTTGQGDVYALNVQDGSMIWKRGLAMPVRSAPKIQHGMVYIMTVDDQVFALDSATGNIAWKHRGISEQVSFLAAIAPAIGENYLVAAYSSGELYGLAADTGQELWNDSLAVARKTSASSIFTGFGGDPVVAGGVAFASSKSGLLAATHVFTGRRLWEQDIAAHGLPFLSGNFLFMLAENTQVLAVHARDGRIKWVTQLPRFDDPEEQEDPYHWHGPIGVNGLLLVVGEHGKMLALSPSDGSVMSTYKIPDGVKSAPVIANGVIYMVSANATLHVLN